MTGYEIKKNIDSTLHFFWSGSFGSIYPTLSALEKNGYVTKQDVSGNKREKYKYFITQTGKDFLTDWLSDPSAKDELRYETLLKLFFSGSLGKEKTAQRIDAFEAKIRAELPFLEMCEANLAKAGDNPDHVNYLLTVRFGIETYNGYLRWCEGAKKLLEER
ncbi:MAG: PadR family transcriptional regulator [Oscillospiraceae bacterium]|nr:PadR family transcriptional regulator [Oscillospiraceae bacterium]